MAGIYPKDPKIQEISIRSNTQTYSSVSQNLSVETRTRGVQRWQFGLSYPALTREEAMQVYAFIIDQQGTFDSFTFELPEPLNSTNGTQTFVSVEGNPMVTDNRTNIGRTIDVGNFNRNQTAALKAGDFFKFSNHEKLYMVTKDLITGSSGGGSLNFTPPLISAVEPADDNTLPLKINGTTIILDNPTVTCSLLTDEFEMPIDENIHYAINIEMGERVSSRETTNA